MTESTPPVEGTEPETVVEPTPETPEATPEAPAQTPEEVVVEPTPETETAVADPTLAPEPTEQAGSTEPTPAQDDAPRHGHGHRGVFDSGPASHPNDDVETVATGGSLTPELSETVDKDEVSRPYVDAVKAGVEPQAATLLAAVPVIGTAVGKDGTHRIVDTNVDQAWRPAPVESDPAERERLEKAQAQLEERLESNSRLLG